MDGTPAAAFESGEGLRLLAIVFVFASQPVEA